jgi:hypothetical protein
LRCERTPHPYWPAPSPTKYPGSQLPAHFPR